MRKITIAGNWKMNNTIKESIELASSIKNSEKSEIIIAPSFVALKHVSQAIAGTNIKLSAQNMSSKECGAFTGEISPAMIKDAGCEYVILGHSERREYYNETNESINCKIKTALSNDLKPILCIGETLDQRELNKTNEIISNQIKECLNDIQDIKNIIIAYEPVWAIGTGKVASPEQAQEVHSFIRSKIKELYGSQSDDLRILYGGSLNPGNASGLLKQPDIDGGLIGGASLKSQDFNSIINEAEEIFDKKN